MKKVLVRSKLGLLGELEGKECYLWIGLRYLITVRSATQEIYFNLTTKYDT